MNARGFLLVLASVFVVLPGSGSEHIVGPLEPAASTVPNATKERIVHAYGRLPLAFEKNRGQAARHVKFTSRGIGYTVYLGSTQAVLVLSNGPQPVAGRRSAGKGPEPPAVLTMTLIGASPAPAATGVEEQPGRFHYFIGNDPTKWHTNVASYARVQYSNVYPMATWSITEISGSLSMTSSSSQAPTRRGSFWTSTALTGCRSIRVATCWCEWGTRRSGCTGRSSISTATACGRRSTGATS